jgi:hypothetical protein
MKVSDRSGNPLTIKAILMLSFFFLFFTELDTS